MLHRRDRQIDADHAADLLGPEAAGIDDMLGDDRALLGDDVPAAVGAACSSSTRLCTITSAPRFLRAPRHRPAWCRRVDIALVGVVQAAIDASTRRMIGQSSLISSGVIRRASSMPMVWNTAVGRLQPLPAIGRAGDVDAAGHVQADRLAALLLELLVEVDRIGLQGRDVGVGVERVEAARPRARSSPRSARCARSAPRRSSRAWPGDRARGADHAAADDHDPIVRFHAAAPPASMAQRLTCPTDPVSRCRGLWRQVGRGRSPEMIVLGERHPHLARQRQQ